MSAQRFETFLARVYSDRLFRERFLATPTQVVEEAGLDEQERRAALDMDEPGLLMAARSYEFKRAFRRPRRSLLRLPWRAI